MSRTGSVGFQWGIGGQRDPSTWVAAGLLAAFGLRGGAKNLLTMFLALLCGVWAGVAATTGQHHFGWFGVLAGSLCTLITFHLLCLMNLLPGRRAEPSRLKAGRASIVVCGMCIAG